MPCGLRNDSGTWKIESLVYSARSSDGSDVRRKEWWWRDVDFFCLVVQISRDL